MAEDNRVDYTSMESIPPQYVASQGGYCDVNFIETPPDHLQCPICISVLKEPHIQSCCGSHMCEVS